MEDLSGGPQAAEAGTARPSRLAKASAIVGVITLIDALVFSVYMLSDFHLGPLIVAAMWLVALGGVFPVAWGVTAIDRGSQGTLPHAATRWARVGVICGLVSFAILFVAALVPGSEPTADHPFPNRPSCQGNLKQIGMSIGMYQADYSLDMPPSLEVLVKGGYIKAPSVCRCPDYSGPLAIDPNDVDATGDYYYTPIKKEYVDDDLVPIAWDKRVRGISPGANVLFASLRVARMPVGRLDDVLDANAPCYVRAPEKPVIVNKKYDWLRKLLQG